MAHIGKRSLGHNIRMASYFPILLSVFVQFFTALFLADGVCRRPAVQLVKTALTDNLHRSYPGRLDGTLEDIQVEEATTWEIKALIRTPLLLEK